MRYRLNVNDHTHEIDVLLVDGAAQPACAEELDVALDRVRVELGETDRVPSDRGTFGSMSPAVDGKRLRAAAAHARRVLLEHARAGLSDRDVS